jgi:hypothetical protein
MVAGVRSANPILHTLKKGVSEGRIVKGSFTMEKFATGTPLAVMPQLVSSLLVTLELEVPS